jgi:hypothetical protein
MATYSARIAVLDAQARQIRAKLNAAKADERATLSRQARKLDARRKLVLGALVLSLLRRGVIEPSTLDAWLAQSTLSERDRSLLMGQPC